MHNFTFKLAGCFAVAGIITVLSVQDLQAGEPGSLKINQKASSPIKQVGYLNDKCGCKQNHVYSYSDGPAYAGNDCPQCRAGSRTSAGFGKRGSFRSFLRCKFGYFIDRKSVV